MPTVSRPPDRKSIDESCLASSTGWRCGNTITPNPNRIRVVSAARWAMATMASMRGWPFGSPCSWSTGSAM
jgi:hypothetical protein